MKMKKKRVVLLGVPLAWLETDEKRARTIFEINEQRILEGKPMDSYVKGPRSKQEVLAKWKRQYCNPDGSWGCTISGPAGETYKRLEGCKTLQELAKILPSWVKHCCWECGKYRWYVISFDTGEQLEFNLCRRCLNRLAGKL